MRGQVLCNNEATADVLSGVKTMENSAAVNVRKRRSSVFVAVPVTRWLPAATPADTRLPCDLR